jgi:hypothetical protein
MKITKQKLKQIIKEELEYSNLKESQTSEATKLATLLQAAGLDDREQSFVIDIVMSGDEELKDQFFGSPAAEKLMDLFISGKAEAYGVEHMPHEVQRSGGEDAPGSLGPHDWILQQLENLTSAYHDPDKSRPKGTLPDQLNTASMPRPGLEEQSSRLRQIVNEQLYKAIKDLK